MTYDRYDWHANGDFPPELDGECGATHIGMFLAWAITRGLESEFLREAAEEGIKAVKNRKMTGREFLLSYCDGKFWEQDLTEAGNAFAKYYYNGEGHEDDAPYIDDYVDALAMEVPSVYHVEDSWTNFDKIAALIDFCHAEFKQL